jgi:uncharacterized lipoprotein YddW (UPF0748 family)
MPLLTITKNTVFKKTTASSSNLSAQDKFAVDAGQTFQVNYAFRVGNHCLVKLQQPLGTVGKIGYFFLGHVQVDLEEVRGVWLTNIDSNILCSRNNIREGLKLLKDLGFNTIYPVVWNRGFTVYPSPVAEAFIGESVMPASTIPNCQFINRDMLAEIIEEAKPHNLRVIPWFEYGLMTLPGSLIEQRHPDLITLDKRGQKIRIKTANGKPDDQIWLNICHPEARKFMVDLIADVAERYEVDGIQLDDHFGFPVELGYDKFTQDLYKEENSGKAAPSNHTNSAWTTWASNKVTSLLEEVFKAVKNKRPDCLISISPNPLDFSKKNYLADWEKWEKNGLVEELVVQVYRNNVPSFENEIKKTEIIKASSHIPGAIGVFTGNKSRFVPSDLIKQQAQKVRDNKLAGNVFFFYETVVKPYRKNSNNQVEQIARNSTEIESWLA